MPKTSSQSSQHEDAIVIFGLGPIGLAIVLESLLKDSKRRRVIAITDRDDSYIRGQVLRLDQYSIDYLESLIGSEPIELLLNERKLEKKYIKNEGKDFYFIQLMDLEKILYAALKTFPSDQLEIIYLPKENLKKHTKINTSSRFVEFTDSNEKQEKRLFKYLIGADGGNHTTSMLVNTDLEEREKALIPRLPTIYENTQRPQTHSFHATAIFTLPNDENSETYQAQVGEKNENNISMTELRKLGWTLNAKPDSTTVIFVKNKLLYIGAEIPEKFTQISDPIEKRKTLNKWLKLILRYYLSEEAINKLEPTQYKNTKKGNMKSLLQATAFEIILEEANRTLTPLLPTTYGGLKEEDLYQQIAYFFQVGDALRKPHYQTGTGGVTGFLESEAYGKFLISDQSISDLIEYHSSIATIRAENREKVDEYLEGQSLKEIKATSSILVSTSLFNKMYARIAYIGDGLMRISDSPMIRTIGFFAPLAAHSSAVPETINAAKPLESQAQKNNKP